MTKKKWNTDAEMSMMGFTIKVDSPDHVKHMIGYVLRTLRQEVISKDEVEEIFKSVHKYNSEGTPVSHFTVNSTGFGRLMTFVRDEEMTELTSTDGVLAYVYNIDAVDCSELGYVFFDKQGGKVRRIA